MRLPSIRKDDLPFLADWFAVLLRWLVLLGAANTLVLARTINWPVLAALTVCGLWNILISLLAVLNWRLPGHRLINVIFDFCTALVLFIFTDGLTGPLVGIGLLVLFSSAIYFEWKGSLAAGAGLALLHTAWALLQGGAGQITLAGIGILAGLNLGTAALTGAMGSALMSRLRRTYQGRVTQRKESDRRIQRAERERLAAFYQMVETLSATLDYRLVMDTSLDLCINVLGGLDSEAGRMVSAVLLFDERDLAVGAGRGLPPADLSLRLPGEQGVLHTVIQSGEPKIIDRPAEDPELFRMLALHGCSSVLAAPLRRGMNAYGVMIFGHLNPRFFNAERTETLIMISQQAVIAIQNARLYQDLQEEKEHIIESQEEARKKLARDLHDGPTQTVSAIAMRLAIAQRLMNANPQEAGEELGKIEELARRTVQEIRTMLFTLRPLALESEGLESALQAMAGKMRDTYQQNVVLDIDPQVVQCLDAGKQSVVFYLAEEAVNNARKHARASEIRVRLRFVTRDQSVALLEIADNGAGFDVKSVMTDYEHRGSLGMVNLTERSDLINGVLHIDSAPGKGTRIQVAIPLTNEAADRLQRGKA